MYLLYIERSKKIDEKFWKNDSDQIEANIKIDRVYKNYYFSCYWQFNSALDEFV